MTRGENMLKRAWALLAGMWALVFLWKGSTKIDGIGRGDVMLALAPMLIGWLLLLAVRFVAPGPTLRKQG